MATAAYLGGYSRDFIFMCAEGCTGEFQNTLEDKCRDKVKYLRRYWIIIITSGMRLPTATKTMEELFQKQPE